MKKNFKIIESDCTEDFYRIYDDLKSDFVSGMKIMDIKKKYGLKNNQWRKYRKEMMEDGTYDKRPRRKPRYITFDRKNKCWKVIRTIKSNSIVYLSFGSESDAISAVQLFEKYGWSKTNSERIKNEILKKGDVTV